MSLSSGTRTEAGPTPSSSEAGADFVAEARAKMQESIINVNQFFPEITGGIKVYSDKFAFLADNRPEIPEEEEPESQEKAEKEEEAGKEKSAQEEEEKKKEEETEIEEKKALEEEETEREEKKIEEEETEREEEDVKVVSEKEDDEEETEENEPVEDPKEDDIGSLSESPEGISSGKKRGKRTKEDETGSDTEGSGLFSTEVGAATSSAGATNLLFLPEHWSSRGRDLSALRGVIQDSTAEHYKAGQVAAKLHRYDTALMHFSKCVQLQPQEATYFERRGEVLLALCDFPSAILNYKRACILQPNRKDLFQRLAFLFLLHGQALFDQKLYPEALEHFSRAAEMQPDRVTYQTRSLACLAALQRHGECLALVNKRLEADATSADLYVMRARLHGMFRNFSLCYFDLKDALSVDKDHGPAQAMLADLAANAQTANARAVELALSGRTREALGRVSLAIEMDPTVASFHVKRGAFHRRLGDFNAAIDDFLLALDKADHDEASPIYAEAQRQLLLTFNDFAVECFAKGYYEEAVVLLNKAIKAEKNEFGLYINRGDCFYRQGELSFALADFHQALELLGPGDNSPVHARIALVHHKQGQSAFSDKKDLPAAEAEFSLAIRHNPSVAHFWMARARVRYAADRDSDGARRDVAAALLLKPQDQEPEDGAASLASRLFPGQTFSEVLGSPLGLAAKEELQVALRFMFPAAEVHIEEPRGHHRRTRRTRGRSRAVPALRECANERALYAELANEKRALVAEVKQRQKLRQNLAPGPTRILPLQPPSNRIRKGGVTGENRLEKEVFLDAQGNVVGRQGEEKGWHQFHQGITL